MKTATTNAFEITVSKNNELIATHEVEGTLTDVFNLFKTWDAANRYCYGIDITTREQELEIARDEEDEKRLAWFEAHPEVTHMINFFNGGQAYWEESEEAAIKSAIDEFIVRFFECDGERVEVKVIA